MGTVYQAEISLGVKNGYVFDRSLIFGYPVGAVGEQSDDTSPEDQGRTIKRFVRVSYKPTAAPVLIPAADLDLTGFIPAPLPGGNPVRNFYAGNYGGTVTWSPAYGVFQGGTAYTAEVSLYSGAGYVFPDGEVPVNHSGALVNPVMFTHQGNNTSGTIRGNIAFAQIGDLVPTTILNYDLQAYIPVPVAVAVPIHTVTTRGDMAVTAVWKDEGGADLGGSFDTFAQGAVYKAEIILTAKTGYAFDPAIRFGYPGGTVEEPQGDDTDGEDAERKAKRFVTVTYKRTEAPIPINDSINLTNLVSTPVAGGTPDMSFYEGTYSGTVIWKKTADNTVHSGLFQAGTAYTAEVTLTPAPGRVFPESVSIIHGSLTVAAFTGEPRRGTIIFLKDSGSADIGIGWL
jgi:hypothetical protein